jgi:hypothetical protein
MIPSEPDSLFKSAKTLVDAAHVNAVSMFTPLLDQFSILRRVDVEHWDFILTVAGVFVATIRVAHLDLEEDRAEELLEVVFESLIKWNSDGKRALDDCYQLFGSEFNRLNEVGHEKRFLVSDAVGIWIVLNVLGKQPQTEEDCRLVRASGTMVTHSFSGWWDK